MFTKAKIQFSKGVLRANLVHDFSLYYMKLFKYFTYNTLEMSVPRYGPHVSIFIPKFHTTDKNLSKYINLTVDIEYNPEEVYVGGSTFIGYYLPIYSLDIEKIRDEIGVPNTYENRLHLCLFNNKHFVVD